MFTADDYQTLHSIVFATDADGRPRYPGYRPEVVELPNGDGRADREKRYAHVAEKYLGNPRDNATLYSYMQLAHAEAIRVARALNVPDAFMPDIRYSALRVLEYPPGATSARHTDFDMFTLLCYRDRPKGLVRQPPWRGTYTSFDCRHLDAIAPGLHIGELGEIVGLGPATPHEVVAVQDSDCDEDGPRGAPYDRAQHSIVYFAIPDHAAVLPVERVSQIQADDVDSLIAKIDRDDWSQVTVGQWLAERMARSRVAR